MHFLPGYYTGSTTICRPQMHLFQVYILFKDTTLKSVIEAIYFFLIYF